jgi:hypothetical protein
MTKGAHTDSDRPTRVLKVTPFELPLPDIAGHDEWLLDEALAETFPASDSVAVSPHLPVTDKRA